MKLLSLICTAFFITTQMAAQNQLAFFAGPQASSAKYSVLEKEQKTTMKYGFQAGILMKTPFEGPVYFAPAVYYSMKGYKVTFTEFADPPDINAIDNNTTIHCFELAPLLQVDLSKKPSHFFIKAGPTIDIQLFGKEKFNLKAGGSVSRKMRYDFDEYGRFAANFVAQFGFETGSGFMLMAQYSYGLTTLNNADFGPNIRHRVFGISFGKYLKRNKIVIDTRNKE